MSADASPAIYVHGYSAREATRLGDQAGTLADLLHRDTAYPPGSLVLECGCGTGAQTAFLVEGSPHARIVSVDRQEASIRRARSSITAPGVRFQVADLYRLPFRDGTFDHVFLCFVLEHLPAPVEALRAVARVLKPGGTLTAIEGDHGSWYCHPQTAAAARAVQCLIEMQARMGGDARIGRKLYPLLAEAGLREVRVSPRMVYVDSSRPELVEGFSRNTFIAMVEGVRGPALAAGLVSEPEWEEGIRDLYRATEADGTFCYTFFKAIGVK